jgi:16S rRNA (guanine966-N2)-methyltransferase
MKPTLRITGGTYRGRRVICPPGEIRPTMDRMRESLFAILGDLDGASFLDLFAGSGIVSLEAASRGAAPVVAVERDRRKREVIERNLVIAGSTITLYLSPVERFLARRGDPFNYIYLDPPFAYPDKASLLRRVASSSCAAAGTIIMIHHPGDLTEGDSGAVSAITHVDRRRYGGSHLDFYRLINDR